MSYHTTTTSVSLSPGVAKQLVGANHNRLELLLQVTGTNPVTFGFGAAPAGVGLGLSLNGASTAGGQGGSWSWMINTVAQPEAYYVRRNEGDAMPFDSIWALSTAGSNVVVIEGFP
jgi:hypothetical protein